MKNLFFTIFLSSFCFFAQAQLSNNFNVTLPLNAKPVGNNTSVQAFESKKYQSNTSRPDRVRHYYTVDNDVTIGFWDGAISKDLQKTLSQRMSELKAVSALGSPNNPSTFSTVKYNGIDYIIEKYQRNGSNYIRFYSDYYDEKSISGVIEFSNENQQKANNMLDTFLNGIQKK